MYHINSFRIEDFRRFLFEGKIIAAGMKRYVVTWVRKIF
jgi:hypothetical protein